MQIYIPTGKKGGKGAFCARLIKEMSKYAQLTNKPDNCDVALQLARLTPYKSRYDVLRINGVNCDKHQDYKSRNRKMARSLRKSHGVIYQSKFSKAMADKHLGKFSGPHVIIPNGDDLSYYNLVKPMQSKFDYNFVTAARWRKHKRLNDIIKSFLGADIPSSCLYVAGNLAGAGVKLSKYAKCKNIKFLGLINHKQLASYLKLADAFIHIGWIDACPNGVVEAIAAGCLVIANNVGGTKELVEPSGGIICNIDAEYGTGPFDVEHPPKIDRSKVATAMVEAVETPRAICNLNVDIVSVAKRYYEFFERVANG